MERKNIPEFENRLLILYALRRLGPMTDMQLLRLMVELDLMNYITLQLSLTDMEAQGQLRQQAHPCGSLYHLTTEGAFILESFLQKIPSSRRERIDAQGEAFRERFRNEQLAPADSFPMPDGRVCVRLRLLEKDASLMDVLLYVSSGEVPTLLQARWQACAQSVYETIMTALTQGYSDRLPPVAPPVRNSLQRCDTGEWLLSLSDQPIRPALTLMLSFPEERLALFCAARWPACCAELREAIVWELRQALPDR